jgi:hypothetical protein
MDREGDLLIQASQQLADTFNKCAKEDRNELKDEDLLEINEKLDPDPGVRRGGQRQPHLLQQ